MNRNYFISAETIGLVAAMAIAMPAVAFAQGNQNVPNAMQGFSQNRNQPVQIDAATLEIRDKDKAATFSGNVRVVQGDTTMRSKTMVVFYDQGGGTQPSKQPAMKAATAGPGGSQQIRRLEARGGVTVTQKDQIVTGETGIFDMRSNSITMTGGVLLTQGPNVVKADRLVVDITNGNSKLECDPGSANTCRVSMVLQPGDKNGAMGGPVGGPGGGLVPLTKNPSSAATPGNRPARATDTPKAGEPTRLTPR